MSTGGIGLREFTPSPSYIVKRFSDTHGWLKLTLEDDGGFTWQFMPVAARARTAAAGPQRADGCLSHAVRRDYGTAVRLAGAGSRACQGRVISAYTVATRAIFDGDVPRPRAQVVEDGAVPGFSLT